jgi:hypothetical protein
MFHLVTFVLRLLALVLAFASFVLAAISLRHVQRRWGTYFSVDPALLVCGIFATAWFLACVARQLSRRGVPYHHGLTRF